MVVVNKYLYNFVQSHVSARDLIVLLWFHLVNWFEEHFLVVNFPTYTS